MHAVVKLAKYIDKQKKTKLTYHSAYFSQIQSKKKRKVINGEKRRANGRQNDLAEIRRKLLLAAATPLQFFAEVDWRKNKSKEKKKYIYKLDTLHYLLASHYKHYSVSSFTSVHV